MPAWGSILAAEAIDILVELIHNWTDLDEETVAQLNEETTAQLHTPIGRGPMMGQGRQMGLRYGQQNGMGNGRFQQNQ